MSNVTYPDVTVTLTGTDGNAFAIIGKVSRAIAREVGRVESQAFVANATSCKSYDHLLSFVMSTVNVD